jgi:dephospho-CoA kinase
MIIGLTGGIASGKSTVSAYLAQKGIPIFDADRSGWHVEEKGSPCLARLVKRFGKTILMADGRLDRTRLAALAFSSKEATQDLNAIVHAAIKEERDAFLRLHKEDALVIIDAPLLLEGQWENVCDEVWLVFIPEEEQVRRAMKRSGITREEVLMRIKHQMPLAEKRKMADVIIDNSQTLDALYQQVDQALIKALRKSSADRK